MKHVTLKQLRAFASVVRTASVTGAAQALHVSPPAITLQMRLLQGQLGVPLIERSAAGMVPTAAGQLLVDTVKRIEIILADGAAGIAALAGLQTGLVQVGVVSTAKYFAPRVLAAFSRAHPGIELRLVVGNRAEIIAALRDHELDLAVMGRPPEELEVALAVIGEHPHVVVAPPGHPLAGRPALPPGELAGETFLVRERGSGTRTLMQQFFDRSAIAPRFGMEIGSNETVKQAVMAGLGIAFLSAHTIELEVQTQRLAVLDVVGLPIVRSWCVVRLAERRPMPAIDKVVLYLTEQGRRFLPAHGVAPEQDPASLYASPGRGAG